jgi:hypothetical protein
MGVRGIVFYHIVFANHSAFLLPYQKANSRVKPCLSQL